MIRSSLNLQKRIKTEPSQTQIIKSLQDSIRQNNDKIQMDEVCRTFDLMNHNPQTNIKYSHIKIALAIYSIFHLIQKLRTTKIRIYRQILLKRLLHNETKINVSNQKFILDRQLQLFQGLNKLNKYTVLIQKKFLLKLSYQISIKKKVNKFFYIIANHTYQNKLIALSKIFQQSKNEKSLLDELSCYYSNEIIKTQEKMAIKFASSTMFIKSINNKVFQYQAIFFIRLNEQKQLETSQFSLGGNTPIDNFQNKLNRSNLQDQKMNGIYLLDSVIKRVFQNYFLTLKLHNCENCCKGKILKSSILNSQSRILKKLIRPGESILELYQSTNDTEQSKKDQEHDDIILNRKKMMYQTYHPELLIQRRVSFVQSSQKVEMAKKQSLELKTINKSNKKQKVKWISLIIITIGALLIFNWFQ